MLPALGVIEVGAQQHGHLAHGRLYELDRMLDDLPRARIGRIGHDRVAVENCRGF
jgi:hypothetical protein